MKRNFLFYSLFVIASTTLLFSCSKSNKQGRYIPKGASFAMIINGESMSSKLPWEEVKQTQFFKDAYADSSTDAFLKTILENPENSGIDIKKDLVFFMAQDSLGAYISLQGTVKDEAKFKTFNTNVLKSSVVTKGNMQYVKGDRIAASWEKEKFVMVFDSPEGLKDSLSQAVSKRDLVGALENVYALKEDMSLGKEEKFTDLVKNKADILFWVNISAINERSPDVPALAMVNLKKLYEDSYYTGAVNFENGKIDVRIKSYSGKDLTEINKKYSGTKLDLDMIRRIPSNDVSVLFALSFKPEGLKEFIKLTGLEGLANIGLGSLGLSFDDFIKANKGDILFAVTDITKDTAGTPKVTGLFSASIADKNSFGKLVEAGNKTLGSGRMAGSIPPLFHNSSEKYFSLGTDKLVVDKFLSTPGNNNFPFLEKASGESSVFYLNIRALMNGFRKTESRDSLERIAMEATEKMWDNVLATGGGFSDGGTTQHIEINLIDKNTNSLKQLNQYMAVISQLQKEKKKKSTKWRDEAMMENQAELDSLLKVDTVSP